MSVLLPQPLATHEAGVWVSTRWTFDTVVVACLHLGRCPLQHCAGNLGPGMSWISRWRCSRTYVCTTGPLAWPGRLRHQSSRPQSQYPLAMVSNPLGTASGRQRPDNAKVRVSIFQHQRVRARRVHVQPPPFVAAARTAASHSPPCAERDRGPQCQRGAISTSAPDHMARPWPVGRHSDIGQILFCIGYLTSDSHVWERAVGRHSALWGCNREGHTGPRLLGPSGQALGEWPAGPSPHPPPR